MNDTTPSEIFQKYAQEEIVIARELYDSTSQKKRLNANLHFHNALACAQKVLVMIQIGEVADNAVRSNMEAIIAECEKHLPYNMEEFDKKFWSDYINRERNIYRKLFGVFKNTKHETFAEMESRYLECRKKVYEGYAFRYGFLSQDKFVQFFCNPSSIYDNGNL